MYKKTLSADGMLAVVRKSFDKITDSRTTRPSISKTDALMTALSAFTFKLGSFNSFYNRLDDSKDPFKKSIGKLFKINNIPSSTRLKEIIDPLDSVQVSEVFKDIFREAQRGKVLEPYVFLNGHYLVAGDGTQYFESKKINCKRCLVKKQKDGTIGYSHQLYAGCLIHPKLKQVIPFAPEPIQNEDGNTKNDCERNASGRFLEKLRRDHPKMNFIITEDGLSSNGPHIRKIQSLGMKFILGAKPGDHKYLYEWVNSLDDGEVQTAERFFITGKKVFRKTTQKICYVNEVPLNDANHNLKVNFLELEETVEKRIEELSHDKNGMPKMIYTWKKEKTTKFTWVTDIKINDSNVFTIMEGGRKRWSIENETFNTLKNMGYNWEHNFGHGEDNLATNFSLLMMLAFTIDQIQELCCPLFRKALERLKNRKKRLWETIRALLDLVRWIGNPFDNWKKFFELIIYGPQGVDTS